MATTPNLTKTVETAADAVAETVVAAPKAVVAVVEAAPVAAAAVIETVAKALPKARVAKAKPTRKAVRKPVAAKRAAKPAAKIVAKPAKAAAKTAKPAKTSKLNKTPAAKAVKAKGKTMTDTVKTITAQGEKLVAELKTRTEDTVAKSKAMFADMTEFNKGNVEAIVESGKIAAKGFEKLGQDAADYTRKSFEYTTSAFKGMAAVKSPTELLKMHSDYVRSTFDMFVAEASRSTEASLKLAGEIAQPISNRFAVAAEKVKLAA